MDLHCTSVGRSSWPLGFPGPCNTSFRKEVFPPLALRKEVTLVRPLRYAIDDEEAQFGVRSHAVPVLRSDGSFVAALSVTGSIDQVPIPTVKGLVQRLTMTARVITAENIPVSSLW
ncbi:MAG: IclR family transcriptional regulator C-terminal domain-containing protein [Candidatus Solibacter sp.]